jgi:Protein of unknown function (DUF3826)
MTRTFLFGTLVIAFVGSAVAQERTEPLTPADIEAAYTQAVEKRTEDILLQLDLKDASKSNRVTDIIIRQYRALRARDEIISTATLPLSPKSDAIRDEIYQAVSKPLHEQFLVKLSAVLTPEQVEQVKDKMTYNKVKVTYDAYLEIVPNLTDTDKAKILELLKDAREVAMDGGSASQKSEIFQSYKNKINDYLDAHGHDVAKAYADWNAKQETAQK